VSVFYEQHGRDPTTQEIISLLPEAKFETRPYATKFLENMSKYFELIIFTAADQIVRLCL
jgi:TFIIF-interacting CTD phosphatase-like protein